MENIPEELDEKPSSNKDMWLFLIVLDVIVLCVLGFFLYKHFAGQVVNPTLETGTTPGVEQAVEELPQIVEEEIVTVSEEGPKNLADLPHEEPILVEEPVQEIEKSSVAVQEPISPAPEAAKPTTPAKQSILVTPVTNSKYRRVTFRWFEPAEKVSLVSGFTNRQPKALKKHGDFWEITLSIAPGEYRFLYIVDGKNTVDPYADQQDGRSVLVVQ